MKKLKTKLTRRLFAVAMVSVLITAIFISFASWFSFSTQVTKDLKDYGQIISESYNSTENTELLETFDPKDYRITLIDQKGFIAFESNKTVSKEEMDNHINRPEIQDALNHGAGNSHRYSDTLGTVTYYYAVRTDNGCVIRVSKEIGSVLDTFLNIIPVTTGIVICILILCIFMASNSTNKIVKPIEKMTDDINSVAYEELVPFATTIEKQQSQIKKQMARVQLEKDKIDALIANMSEGFLLLDMDKNILISNDSAAVLLSSISKNIIGKNVIELSRNNNFNNCINDAIKGKSGTVKFDHKDKSVQIIASPVFSDNKQKGVICLVMNITEKEKTEKIRREFTANVSHELKTPLTSISGYAEMIENGMVQEDDIQRFAGKIHKEAGRLISLIVDIIELSHLDEPRKKLEKHYIKLKEVTEECFDTLHNSADKRSVELKYNGDNSIIMANRAMIYEVIYNLCDNAIRYNKPGGSVEVTIKDKVNKVEIIVSDTGIGIPQKHQNRIFERFYRVDKSHSKETGGTGLGLAIVKHIIEQHQGNISVDSQENVGTSITVTLPK